MTEADWQEWAHWTFQVPREPKLTLDELRQAMCVSADARENALKAALAETRDALQKLQKEHDALKARGDGR